MSRQDKATTERNAKILRELVKHQDNKVCADCKRNDPRWASWNLGVFLCIRCSGIHRGMGTHISRVKSVDLDIWTPEQMESIQKWGNHRANLYWEAHLKAGHVPPDHKMESFIRSKYESRRWALDGPPPPNPSVLESATSSGLQAAEQLPHAPTSSSRPTNTTNTANIPSIRPASPALQTHMVTRQPHSRQLLSSVIAGRTISTEVASPASAAPTPAPQQALVSPAPPPQDDLFSLDFHAPAQKATSLPPAKDMKSDIMSLFSSTPSVIPSVPHPTMGTNAVGALAVIPQAQPWDQLGSAPQAQPQPTSMMGTSGAGFWGAASGWNTTPVAPAQNNLWGSPVTPATQQPQSQLNAFDTNNIWGPSASVPSNTNNLFGSSQAQATPKKDDVFGDLWGDFK